MEKIVPTISSSTVGPLGLCHLPRLWLKVLLHATGRLAEGYRHGAAGLDEAVLDAIGVDLDEFLAYIAKELPTYVQCERWIREHATNLTPAAIEKWNESLRKRTKTEAQSVPQRAFVGIEDPSVNGAILLNDLDDWMCVHGQAVNGKLPPIISASLNAEFTELLRVLLKETGAARTVVRVDIPEFGLHPVKPLAETRRDGVPSTLERAVDDPTKLGPIEYLKRVRRPLIQNDLTKAEPGLAPSSPDVIEKYGTRSRMVGPVFAGGKLVAWISVHETNGPRAWSAADVAALTRTAERMRELVESVGK